KSDYDKYGPKAYFTTATKNTKKYKKGDLIALTGFGAGLTYGSLIMRWSK
ncbi:MAG: 3-oxoacyl-[acyl-carrier-protein] synthase III C-terminal domain-containing protein, partial [Fusobacterium sp.]